MRAIALMSFNGKLGCGLNADCDRVPDLDYFARALQESFLDLPHAASLPSVGSAAA